MENKMKKYIAIFLLVFTLFTLVSCKENNEIELGEGLKLAGYQAGNKAVQYSFTYPDTWELCRNDGVIEIQFDCDESATTAKFATISVLAFDLEDPSQLAKDYWESHEEDIKSVYTDYKLLDTEELVDDGKKLGNTVALKVKYSGTLNGISYFNEQIICCRSGSVYLVTLVVPSEYESKVVDVLETVRKDFIFE